MEERQCVMCRRSVYRQRRHVLHEDIPQRDPQMAAYIREHAVIHVEFNNVYSTCHRCWQRLTNDVPRIEEVHPNEAVQPNAAIQPQERTLEVDDFMRAPNRADRCIFNNCHNETRLRIPMSIKIHMLCEHNLYIPGEARACRQHLESNNWNDLINNCRTYHDFNAAQFTDICNIFKNAASRGTRFDFDSMTELDNEDLFFWVGFNYEQFNIILNQTPSLANQSRPRTVLGVYLTKLRTGESNERLASLFGMSRRTLERKLKIARECIEAEFTPLHLGFDHITRNNILERNLLIPKHIFGNSENSKAIVICDGTYIYIEKSSNFLFQRLSYSLHKYENLLKPFMIVSTDGYILDVLGPYAATTSDATIMQDIMRDENSAWHWIFQQNDVILVDRGFRDSLASIEEWGYEVHIPPTKDRNETQLTTDQANKSRTITISRWVVEAMNGKIKQCFRLLRQTYINRALPHMFVDFKIGASLLNAFRPVFENHRLASDIINIIDEKINNPNRLFDYVELKNLNRQRRDFVRMEANLPFLNDFPRLTEECIVLHALGTYHIKLAKSYVAEHFRDGVYLIELYREESLDDLNRCNILQTNVWLLRIKIQSRHVRSRTYNTYILIDRDQIGRNAIVEHYCTCLTGRRTVGSCAHIVSVLWFLGLGRHEPFIAPAEHLLDVIVDDNH
ncbi:uncharacterized protein LOC123705641 [Colias croceus]|uniref:uncharacterized protein LOC123705641 n=1 Tax=Colias crocea TaxID=72248 RepID=UPI001E281A84|nr:uncharacterized protein LOC123705641 [Colias croceus]